MQAFIVAPLGNELFPDTVTHCKHVQDDLKKIFKDVDPDLTIKTWYSSEESIDELSIAMVAMRNSAVVYFCKGWNNCKESKALHYICELYGVQRMEE